MPGTARFNARIKRPGNSGTRERERDENLLASWVYVWPLTSGQARARDGKWGDGVIRDGEGRRGAKIPEACISARDPEYKAEVTLSSPIAIGREDHPEIPLSPDVLCGHFTRHVGIFTSTAAFYAMSTNSRTCALSPASVIDFRIK